MGIASYVINFDELGQILSNSLGENVGKDIAKSLSKNFGNDFINNIGKVINDNFNNAFNQKFTTNISNSFKDALRDTIVKIDDKGINININALNNAIKSLEKSTNNKQDEIIKEIGINNSNQDNLLKKINDNNLKQDLILKVLKEINSKIRNTEKQRVLGKMLNIPALKGDYEIEFDIKGEINGLTYSQTGWRYEDSWDLKIDDDVVFENSRTKEVAEHKFLNGYNPCQDKVIFIYHNNSATSKVLWVDLEYFQILK